MRRRLLQVIAAAFALAIAGGFASGAAVIPRADHSPGPFGRLSPEVPGAAGSSRPGLTPDPEPASLQFTDIADWYTGTHPRYRIPALARTNDGTLLALYDGRPDMNDVPGNIAVLGRRSTDGGKTWGPAFVLRAEPAPKGFGDPSLLIDRETGRIFAFYVASVNQGFFGSATGNDENDPDVLQADYSYSDDAGVTWRHRRITAQIKDPAWAGMFASSGEGIQLRTGAYKGRLLQQYTVRFGGQNHAMTAYSDDHGETWHHSALVGPGADENKVVELSTGQVLLNVRSAPHRKRAVSDDGGQTWSALTADPGQLDPGNNGSLVRAYPDASTEDPRASILLLSNTADTGIRRNLTLAMSCDAGQTWAARKVVYGGSSAYSTLTPFGNGKLGLLFERDGYRRITYTDFDIDSLGMLCAPLNTGDAALVAGSAGNVPVRVTNQTRVTLPAGTIKVVAPEGWTAIPMAVPRIAAGTTQNVTVRVTAPLSVSGRRDLRIEYTSNGRTATEPLRVTVASSGAPVAALVVQPFLDAVYPIGDAGLIGDEMRSLVRVTNTGNVAVTGMTVASSAGNRGCAGLALQPGQSTVCRDAALRYRLTAADVAAGKWQPVFTATGIAAGKPVVASARLAPVDLTSPPALKARARSTARFCWSCPPAISRLLSSGSLGRRQDAIKKCFRSARLHLHRPVCKGPESGARGSYYLTLK